MKSRENPEGPYVRGLEAIGALIDPAKPLSDHKVRALIKRGLPAKKVEGIGWIVKREDVLRWVDGEIAECKDKVIEKQ